MKESRNKTVFIFTNLQYSTKYILQTRLIESYRKYFDKVVIVSPNSSDEGFIQAYKDKNIIFEQSNYLVSEKYKARRINRLFSAVRRFIYPAGNDLGTIHLKKKFLDYRKKNLKLRFYYSLIFQASKLISKSVVLRNLFFKMETLFYPTNMHSEIYSHYKPDLVIFQDLGTIERTNYQINEAKKRNIKTAALILSWDNLTAKGMGAIKPDYISVWNNDLKKELIHFHEIEENRISVDGNPVFDDHFRFAKKNNFKTSDEKIIFFATGSPGWFKDIAKSLEVLLEANKNGLFIKKIKFIVRLHPVFLIRSANNKLVKNEIQALEKLSENYGESIELFYPKLISRTHGYEFEKKDILDTIETLQNCDILLTNYSTMMLEACIFNKPIINIGYDNIRSFPMKSHEACLNETHLKNIFSYDFALVAKTKEQAIDQINSYLMQPDINKKGREKVKNRYCGVNAGSASEAIVRNMFSKIN